MTFRLSNKHKQMLQIFLFHSYYEVNGLSSMVISKIAPYKCSKKHLHGLQTWETKTWESYT